MFLCEGIILLLNGCDRASLRLSGNFALFIMVFAMSHIGALSDLLPAIIILGGIISTPADFF